MDNTHENEQGFSEWNSLEDFLQNDVHKYIQNNVLTDKEALALPENWRRLLARIYVTTDMTSQPLPPAGTDFEIVYRLYAEALNFKPSDDDIELIRVKINERS